MHSFFPIREEWSNGAWTDSSVELTRSRLRPTYRESQPRAPELRRSSEWFLGMPKRWHEVGLFLCQGLRGIGRECRKDVGGWDTDAGKERA